MIQRRGVQQLREIGIGPGRCRLPVGLSIPQAHMPFTHHARAVPGPAQHARQRRPVGFNQGITLRAEEHPPFHPAAPRITAGK